MAALAAYNWVLVFTQIPFTFEILCYQIHHAPVIDAIPDQSQQHRMIDAGVVVFDIAAEDELIFWQQRANVPHGSLSSAFLLAVLARNVITATREVEPAVEHHHRQRLQHQGVESRPELDPFTM